MDELIILLIRAIGKMLGGEQAKKPPQTKSEPLPPMRGIIPPMRQQQQQMIRAIGGRRRKPVPARPVPPRAPVVAPDILEVIPDAPPTSARAAQRASVSNTAVTAHNPSSVNATAIRRWLTPSTLQKQFILTEIFQPPLAMRGDR
jgi:hypothetical protein